MSSLPVWPSAAYHVMIPGLPRAFAALILWAMLSSCATPVFKDVGNRVDVAPSDVQQNPEAYAGAEIVWGGRIIAIENLENSTEVEVVAYPLDQDQRPDPNAPTQGRFILSLAGFAEPFDYPSGRHLSVHGVLSGTRIGQVQDQPYLFPLVRAKVVFVWPWGFMFDKKPHINIGVGVSTHIY